MIRTALEFLTEQLNQYIKLRDPDNFGNSDAVVLSGLMEPDGTFSLPMDQGSDEFKVVLTLVNLEEDRIAESQLPYQKINQTIQVVNPPVNINAYVLFSVYSIHYPTALTLLSNIISFFQTNTLFTAEKHPHMNAKVEEDKPWKKIGRLAITFHGTTFEQQNNLWATLGAKYMPNAIYKIRTISFVDMEPKMDAPPITEINLLNG